MIGSSIPKKFLLLLLLILGFPLLSPSTVIAEETGFKFPTTCTTNGSSCDNMKTQDNQYNSWVQASDEYIDSTFTDFEIPNEAIIDDIQIKLRIRTSTSGWSWFNLFSENAENTYYSPFRCFPTSPNSCQYNTNTSFNSISQVTFTWLNTNHLKKVIGAMINNSDFKLRLTQSAAIKNTDIDVLLFNIRYHMPDPNPTPPLPPGVTSYLITPGFTALPGYRTGTFYEEGILFNNFEAGDKILLSSSPDGTGNIGVADVLNAHNSAGAFIFSAVDSCSLPVTKTLPPTDLTYLVSPSFPTLSVSFIDQCLRNKEIGPIYLVQIKNLPPPPPPGPSPFLDLPWNFGSKINTTGKSMSFTDAALTMKSFFDHKYPLLSRSLALPEPDHAKNLTVGFDGLEHTFYSSHDGYDWGSRAQTKLHEPVLAAASGTATFKPEKDTGGCGNMILIDHHNNFQTRYCHLDTTGLILTDTSKSAEVLKGDKIGEVGFTGNVDPPNSNGSHLHFMVIEDKNKDEDFNDNIPDGLVDPFGWQATTPDPWENYTFNYLSKDRTGNKSYYLWNQKLDGLSATISSGGGVLTSGKVKLDIPPGAINNTETIKIESRPMTTLSNTLESLGSTVEITANDTLNNPITTFNSPITIIFDFSSNDLKIYKLATLAIYSSVDGNTWVKEATTLDLENMLASALIGHLTHFALIGELADTTPPVTTPNFTGEKGKDNNFRSDITLSLSGNDADGLGVANTFYRMSPTDDRNEYKSPLSYTDEGVYQLEYFSIDNSDNSESPKSTSFSIDRTIPEIEAQFDQNKLDIVFSGKDASKSAEITEKILSKYAKEIAASDNASNTAHLTIDKRVVGNIITLELNSLQYNSTPAITPPNNKVIITFAQNKDKSLKSVVQGFYLKGDALVVLTYESKTNTTQIWEKKNGKIINTKVTGLKILKLFTDKGLIKYSY